MGRKLKFDRDKAMLHAMESFWAKGYDAMSMRDLADRLGIHLGSVYNALGDKKEVFEASMRLHIENHMLPSIAQLAQHEDPLSALDRFMDNVVEECGGTTRTPGCFLINSLLEINSINDSITSCLQDYLEKIEAGFFRCIENAVAKGQLPDTTDKQKAAKFVLASLFSLRVMGKFGMPVDYIRDIKQSVTKALRAGIVA